MGQVVKRGYVPTDEKEFSTGKMEVLRKAATEMCYLINRGYPIKSVSVFVGNHYLLSERQRLAIVRSISTDEALEKRAIKEIKGEIEGETVYIDGLNLIITLEVALSQSTLIQGMDGTIRDLAGLRGTYRLIDKTDEAILMIGRALEKLKIEKAVVYLDSPVSNTGRLKTRMLELLSTFKYETEVELVPNADVLLMELDHVITSDAIILDHCKSWVNLVEQILKEENTSYLRLFE